MPTNEFQVEVDTQYLPMQSDPEQGVYRFAYTITITNLGSTAAQLVAREWHILDAKGGEQQVRGLGVVGRQPLLQPGESHRYTSGCELPTPQGSMHGSYLCVSEEAEIFHTPIPLFVLDAQDASDGSSPLAPPPSRVLH